MVLTPGLNLKRFIWVGFFLPLVCSVNLRGEESTAGALGHVPDTNSRFEGMIIDTIAVEPRNIYDTKDPEFDGRIFRLANSLHIVTRRKIVRRELLFRVGDLYSTELAEEIGRNLRRSHALNDAWVTPEILPDGRLLVRVVTVDRWSLVGGFQARREGNRTNYKFGFEERNFLGYHQLLSLDYHVQQVEDSYIVGRFSDRRLWGFPISLDLKHSSDPQGSLTSSALSHPYYNLSQHWTYSIQHAATGGRLDFPHDTVRVASTNLSGDFVQLSGGYRWGPYRNKFALGADYQYVYKAYYDSAIFYPLLRDAIVFPTDSLYHRTGAAAEFSNYEFVRIFRIRGMQYPEDLTLGFTARVEYARALGARFQEYAFDDFGLRAEYTAQFGGSILIGAYQRATVMRKKEVLRRADRLTLRYYNTSVKWVTLAAKSLYHSEEMANGSNALVLGGESGIRGYDTFFRTGDRLHVVNAEVRLYPQLELLSLIFGGAVFMDFGRTWKNGERQYLLQDYYRSWGIGLRVSLEKISRGEMIRIDLANSQDSKWQLSVNSQQYF